MGNYTIFRGFENPGRGRQARNLTTNAPKILDLKSTSEQIFFKNCRWVPLIQRLQPFSALLSLTEGAVRLGNLNLDFPIKRAPSEKVARLLSAPHPIVPTAREVR